MIFETKKVPLETLGEYLAEIRANLGLTVVEVVDKSGIGEKYLLHLEAGEYHHLPPDVYILGFLRKLADLYSIPAETLLSQYKKERGIIDHVANNLIVPVKGWRAWLSYLVVTPKLLSLAGGIGLVGVALVYLFISVSSINRTPDLTIFEPANGSIIKSSVVNVSGQADPGSIVAINGQNIFVDTQGNFRTTLGTAAGQKELAITAQNKFGKRAEEKLLVIVEDPLVAEQKAASQLPKLDLELKFSRAATIEINRDGVDLARETVPADGVKNIHADNKIVLTTSDAGSISASLNGRQLGVLGRAQEPLTIPFTVDNDLLVQSRGTGTLNP
jgi:transcriptional regulator with XRE-family HTH domain